MRSSVNIVSGEGGFLPPHNGGIKERQSKARRSIDTNTISILKNNLNSPHGKNIRDITTSGGSKHATVNLINDSLDDPFIQTLPSRLVTTMKSPSSAVPSSFRNVFSAGDRQSGAFSTSDYNSSLMINSPVRGGFVHSSFDKHMDDNMQERGISIMTEALNQETEIALA